MRLSRRGRFKKEMNFKRCSYLICECQEKIVGYAYGYDEEGNKVQKMKTIPYGLVICTAGHPNEFLDEIGIAELPIYLIYLNFS